MIKTVIFDFDGVLVESVDLKTRAFAKLFEPQGDAIVKQVVEYHLANTGVSRFEKFRYFYKNILKRELDQKTFDSLCDKYAALVVDEVVGAQYVKGADKFLDENSAHLKCFVVSATPQDEIEKIIQRRNMSGYFVKIYGAPKAKKNCVSDILSEYNLKPNETVYVGDALSDYDAAISNKIWFILRINKNEYLFTDKKPFARINDLTTLKEILSKL